MRLDIGKGIALLAAAAVSACGGSSATSPSSSGPSLSAFDRALVLEQIVTAAASGIVGGLIGKSDSSVPLGNLTCDKTCSGGSCALACPIDEQLACPSGGTATDRGRIAGVLDAALTGDATLEAAQGFAACKPNGSLTIDGAPGTTATGTVRFVDGQLADRQTVRIAGSVRYASADRSGTCAVDVTVTFSRTLHGSASGTACGQAVDESF
jgi:hypothetical protein